MSDRDTRPPRPGEELDEERLATWLEVSLGLAGPLEVTQFPGGHSNLTYLVRTAERELVLRRPPVGAKVRTAHDMGREHRVLSLLAGRYTKAPRPLALCTDPTVLGAPFYVMDRVRGIILRGAAPPSGVDLSPLRMRALSEAAVDALAELHAVDVRTGGTGGLAELGRPEGYVERQVTGWSERWRAARIDDAPDVDAAAGWLAAHPLPASSEGPALVHNDFKYDNLVLDPDDPIRIRAVLDWEMATVGDPRMDLGTTLGYWVERGDDPALAAVPSGPTTLPGNLSRAEIVDRWSRATGRDPGDPVFLYVFGLFKIAVIAQQIYYRYRQGLTRDERFAALPHGVAALGRAAAGALDRKRIDP